MAKKIVDAIPDNRLSITAAPEEKMGERQTWHTYIPYTDTAWTILGGVIEQLRVPDGGSKKLGGHHCASAADI